jgi:hypothetical protein
MVADVQGDFFLKPAVGLPIQGKKTVGRPIPWQQKGMLLYD